jgi:hypothetical protein
MLELQGGIQELDLKWKAPSDCSGVGYLTFKAVFYYRAKPQPNTNKLRQQRHHSTNAKGPLLSETVWVTLKEVCRYKTSSILHFDYVTMYQCRFLANTVSSGIHVALVCFL